MADNIVDILGFLQPDSGNNWNAGLFLDGNAKIIFAFEDAVPYVGSGFGYYVEGESKYSDKSYTYAELYKFLNDRKLLPDVPDKTNLPPVIVGYSGPNTNKQNIIVNMNQRPIFRKVYYSKWPCLKDLEKSGLQRYLLTVQDHVESYERYLLRGSVVEANKREASYIRDMNLLVENIKEEVDAGSWDKNKIPACFLPDPDPALLGPPSQTVYGVLNKPPSVDDPNIKLPSQTPKQLDPNKALTEVNTKDDDLEKMMDKSSADLDKQMAKSSADLDKQMSDSAKSDPFDSKSDPFDSKSDPFDSASSTPSTPAVDDPNATYTRTVKETSTSKTTEKVTGGGSTIRTSFSSDDPRSRMTQAQLDALPNGAGQTEFKIPGKNETTTTTDTVSSTLKEVKTPTGSEVVAKLESNTNIKVKTPKVESPKFVKDGLGDNWSPNKFRPETIAGNTKFVDPVTGNIGSTEKIAAVDKLKSSIPDIPKPNIPSLPQIPIPSTVTNADAALSKLSGNVGSLSPNNLVTPPNTLVQAATGGLVGGGIGAGIGAIAGGSRGALIGGLSGAALGGGAVGGVVSGVTGAAGSVVSGVTGAVGGALSKIPLVGGAAGGLVSGVGGAAGGLVSGVGGAAGGLVSGVGGAAGGLVSGVTGAVGGALSNIPLVGGVAGGLVSGAGGLVGGAISGVTGAVGAGVGAAAAKLALVKKGMPKPKIPKPPSAPRLKKVKLKAPSNTKGAEDLLNLQKSKLNAAKAKVGSQITANIDTNQLNSYGGLV